MIDWNKPIEAVHEDGRVVPATHSGAMTAADQSRWVKACFDDAMSGHWFNPNGGANHTRWRIRNVQPTTPELDPMRERLEALARAIADVPVDSVVGRSGYACEARAIVADLPKPVDPDLLEARKVCENTIAGDGSFENGEYDDGEIMVCALAAIRRGRALQRGEA